MELKEITQKREKYLKKQARKEKKEAKRLAKKNRPHSMPRQIIWTVVIGVVWMLAAALAVLSVWYQATFDMEFAELLFTLLSPVGGTGQSTSSLIIASCVPAVVVLALVYVAIAFGLHFRTKLCKILRRVGAWVCVAAFLVSATAAVIVFRIPRYIMMRLGHTMIYDEYYIDPNTVDIYDTDGVKKNLIYVYVESMETTYASKADGGAQSKNNYIPNMTELAFREENFHFSDGNGLGGFHSVTGTGWTMGALMSTTSGIPFSQDVIGDGNEQGKNGNFCNDLTALGDILEKEGYTQEFLCGSDASFAGRDSYFKQHGNYEIFDLYTAREKGYIEDDYYVWWGYDDYILFDIARDEITRLASGSQPFNFTMLTVDTHHVGGWQCDVCGDEYKTRLENVIACTDKLVGDFIAWCETQPWYEDTVIIISGDHPRMDRQLVDQSSFYDRTIYNCFINSEVSTENTKNRVFTSMDMFPTILAAMGYTIEGDRLGLGTNLFSDLPTLAEELGYDYMNTELGKYSAYYKKHFS